MDTRLWMVEETDSCYDDKPFKALYNWKFSNVGTLTDNKRVEASPFGILAVL